MASAERQPWRWLLGGLYVLTLGLDAGLAIRLGWLFYGHSRTMAWHWLALELWLLTGLGLLALALGLINAFRRRVGRALAWLILNGLALGSCAVAFFPVALMTVGDPPHVDDM